MTQDRLFYVLFSAGIVGAGALWLYALTLAGPVGRNRLCLGIPELVRDVRSWGHHGDHEVTGVTEADRIEAYAAMVGDAPLAPQDEAVAAPLILFAQEIKRADDFLTDTLSREESAKVRAELDALLNDAVKDFSRRVEEVLAQWEMVPA